MPIFTAIATSIVVGLGSAAFAATTLGTFLVTAISAGLSTGVSFLVNKYFNRQKKRSYGAFKSHREYGGDIPRQGHFGITAQKGHFVRGFKWGAGNKYNTVVLALSDGWCDGLEPYIIMDGERLDLVAKPAIDGEAQHWGIDGFEDLTSIRYYDGRPGQVADAKLISDTGGSASTVIADNVDDAWNGTDIGTNTTYLIFEKLYSDRWQRVPDITWVGRGLRCYDFRLDDTISGGGGTHRLDDPATWQYTNNAIVQRANYLLGTVKGIVSGRTLIGMGKPVSHLDVNAHIIGSNVCDELRFVEGENIKRYQCNLIAQGSDDHSEILKEFDDAVAGYGLTRSGLASIIVGAPQVPVLEITDDMIIGSGEIIYQPRKPASELYNILTGQFTSPEGLFTPASLTPVKVNSDIAADKQINQVAYNFLQVLDPRIAQYLLNIRYRQNRLGGSVSLFLMAFVAVQLNAGDWVTWRGKTWLVGMKAGASFNLSETSADIYQEAGIDAGPVVIPPTTPSNPSVLSTVQGFNAVAGIIQGDGIDQTPVLRFTWTPPDDPTITAVVIRYYDVTNINEIFEVQSASPESGSLTTSEHIESNRIYIVRATIRTIPDRLKTYTALATTAATPRKSRAVTLAELTGEVTEAREFAFAEIRDLKDRLMQFGHDVAQTNIIQLEKLDALEVKAGGARASITQTRKVAVTDKLAFAAQITTVQSNVGDVAGDVVTLNQTVTTNEQATATAITNLTAALDDVNLAEGLLKFEAVAAPTGVTSRIAIFTKATAGDAFAEAGIYIDSTAVEGGATESSILLLADKTTISNPDDPNSSVQFVDGKIICGSSSVVLDQNGLSLFDDS